MLQKQQRLQLCNSKEVIFAAQEAPILLCDEATSALDSRTEGDILDALQQLAAGRTSLFVAHRLSTAAQADKIVVLDKVRLLIVCLCAFWPPNGPDTLMALVPPGQVIVLVTNVRRGVPAHCWQAPPAGRAGMPHVCLPARGFLRRASRPHVCASSCSDMRHRLQHHRRAPHPGGGPVATGAGVRRPSAKISTSDPLW